MSATVTTPTTTDHELRQIGTARSAAVAWLLACRADDGWWRDFTLAPGSSDEWVTAYVGSVLAGSQSTLAPRPAAQAWALLASRQRPGGGWGYNALTPPDADSTIWALRLARLVGAGQDEAVRRGREWLSRHRRAGGLATYCDEGPIRAFTGIGPRTPFSGWCSAHTCVTAAAACDPVNGQFVRYLRATQRGDGSWSSYWWVEPAYATALATQALARAGNETDRTRVTAAVGWAARRLRREEPAETGGTFAAACCLKLLSTVPDARLDEDATSARATAAQRLLQEQLPSGAWAPSARLRVPPPDVVDPDDVDDWVPGGRIERAVVLDQGGLFTTATALDALDASVRRRGQAAVPA